MEGTMATIAERPRSFTARDELIAGLRSARHDRYPIFVVMDDEEIQIVRVLHGARDLPQAFGTCRR
jgi:toxin ParE1/3/4